MKYIGIYVDEQSHLTYYW